MGTRLGHIALVCALALTFGGLSSSGKTEPAPEDTRDAWWYLEHQVALGPRNPGSEGHRQVRAFLADELERHADRVEVDTFAVAAEGQRHEMSNIAALFKSADGRSEPYVLLGAHFDTRPFAECDPEPSMRHTPIIGANDGGSGVAVLMDIAGTLAVQRPPFPVKLVFFDGEDFGSSLNTMFYGSRRFAANVNPSEVRCMILLDMVGDADLGIYIEGNSYANAPKLVEAVWACAAATGHGDVFHNEVRHRIYDDHIPFIYAGIPAIDIIDFDYPYWHTTGDTIDKCGRLSLNAVRDVVLDFIFNSNFNQ